MVGDLLRTLVDRPGFEAAAHATTGMEFEVSVSDSHAVIALLLRRQRARSGLSLAQVAERLGARSANSYARY